MVIYSASSYVLLGMANLIIMSACMDYCDTIENCHGPADTMSDRQHYIHAFNFNKSVEKHLHDLDHFKLSCKKLLGKSLRIAFFVNQMPSKVLTVICMIRHICK